MAEARKTWESIAASFDATRRTPWPPVVDFLSTLRPGSRVVDAGTGNGRHAWEAAARGLRVVGLDVSRALLSRARDRAPSADLVQGVVERQPFRSDQFDAGLCIATVHHVRGRSHRLEAWRELGRVLKAGAPGLVSVWSRTQPRFQDLERFAQPQPFPGLPSEPGDIVLRWTQHGLDVPRFIHLYTADELRVELAHAAFRMERLWSPALTGDVPDNHFALVRSVGESF